MLMPDERLFQLCRVAAAEWRISDFFGADYAQEKQK
jgi:hypothetical protein